MSPRRIGRWLAAGLSRVTLAERVDRAIDRATAGATPEERLAGQEECGRLRRPYWRWVRWKFGGARGRSPGARLDMLDRLRRLFSVPGQGGFQAHRGAMNSSSSEALYWIDARILEAKAEAGRDPDPPR